MMKEQAYIHNQNDLSVGEVHSMLEDLDDMMFHLEKFTELMREKLISRHPTFAQFARAIIISNCTAVSYTIKVKKILEESLENYLEKVDDSFTGRS